MPIQELAGVWMLGALVGLLAAQRRGFPVAEGIIGGLVLGPLLAWLLFLRAQMPRCPACAEFVKAEATVCKHCQHALTPASGQPSSSVESYSLGRDLVTIAVGGIGVGLLTVFTLQSLLF